MLQKASLERGRLLYESRELDGLPFFQERLFDCVTEISGSLSDKGSGLIRAKFEVIIDRRPHPSEQPRAFLLGGLEQLLHFYLWWLGGNGSFHPEQLVAPFQGIKIPP